jgi:hypothetical protein
LSVYEIQQSKYRQGYHVTVIVVSGQNADTQLWKRDDKKGEWATRKSSDYHFGIFKLFLPLYCLSSDLRILIIPLVSSNFLFLLIFQS